MYDYGNTYVLESLIEYLNKLTNSPATPYTHTESGELVANVGNFHLACAFNCYCLRRMCNEHGGFTTPLVNFYITKTELNDRITGYIAGIEFALENMQKVEA